MRHFFYGLFVIFLPLLSCEYEAAPKRTVSATLRHEAVECLRSIMTSDLRWEKVHAAEYLIKLDYRSNIDRVFRLEEESLGAEPYYRIGIWRVLASFAANEGQRKQWVDKIRSVYADSSANDRTHAIEALAKLKISPRIKTDNEDDIMFIFSSWADAYSSESRKQEVVRQFLDIIESEEKTNRERKLAAYALRHIGGIGASDWNRLANVALSEKEESNFRIYLYSLCWLSVPPDSTSSPRMIEIRNEFLHLPDSAGMIHQRELALAIAEKGDVSHLPLLVSMFDLPGRSEHIKFADVQAAAAYAILRIDRRSEPTLARLDWVIIFVYGTLMLTIGWYYSKRNKTKEDYLLGGRKMNSLTVGISLFATLLSTLSYLSYPGEMIKYGPVIFTGMIGFPFVYFVAGWWLIPRIMEMKVTSAYEILELRLGLSVRMLATFMFLSLRFLWMATMIYVTVDVAFLAVVPIDEFYVPFISILLLGVTIIYTSMGGLKAVVLTDVIQSIVFMAGAFLSIIIVCQHFGSFTSWFPSEWPSYWKPFQIGFDAQERATVGNATLMLFTWYICTTGSDQMAIQRYLSTKNIQSARRSLKVSLYANLLAKCLLGILGLAMFAFFTKNPHFLADGRSLGSQADTLFPRFILLGLPVGLSGLVIAGLLAAAMSSLSSGLNSVSTVVSEDILKRFSKRKHIPSFGESLTEVKILSYLTGLVVIILSLFVGSVKGNLFDIVVKVVNLFVAPLFVLFFMALFVPFASERGTFVGGIAAIAVAIAIAFLGAFGISVLWIMPFSFLSGSLVGCLVSLVDKFIKKRI